MTTSDSASMRIPYIDLARQHAPIKEELLAVVGAVIDEGQFVLGRQVAEFEGQFARLCGVSHAVGVNSGTDALILALRALGIGPGDEVITAPNSFVASASSIALAGARPVFVDVGEDYNMDPERLAAAITPRTKAVMPVHLTGHPCAMGAILEIAAAKGVQVVEDCAQAVLAEYDGRRVGSFGAIGCFSTHPLKTLNSCGDGGVVVTDDAELRNRLGFLRNLGLRSREDCVEWSPNSRLDTVQAAVLLVKLRYVEGWTSRRRANARRYRQLLVDVPEIRCPRDGVGTKAAYHTFAIQAERRDELQRDLQARGIGTAVHYPVPIHLTAIGRGLGYGEGDFPVAEAQARRVLSLPVHHQMTDADLEEVCGRIEDFYRSP